MTNYILDTHCGDTFISVAKNAKDIVSRAISGILVRAAADGIKHPECPVLAYTVEFEFNDVRCLVDRNTNLNWLYRDYCNAHIMEWSVVGTNCLETYTPEVQAELQRREKASEERAEKRAIKWKAEELAKTKAFKERVKGIRPKLVKVKKYKEWKDNQNDGYGLACFSFAENWAKLMQKEFTNHNIENPDVLSMLEYAEKCSHDADTEGITGFMYGMAVTILAEHWKYGEALRKWHNKEYGCENTEGVVNPAILTIKTK